MEKAFNFKGIFILLLSIFFMGCNTGSGNIVLSDEEVSLTALSAVGSTMLTIEFLGKTDENYDSSAADYVDKIIAGSFTVSEERTVFTFNECEMNVDDNNTDVDWLLFENIAIPILVDE